MIGGVRSARRGVGLPLALALLLVVAVLGVSSPA